MLQPTDTPPSAGSTRRRAGQGGWRDRPGHGKDNNDGDTAVDWATCREYNKTQCVAVLEAAMR